VRSLSLNAGKLEAPAAASLPAATQHAPVPPTPQAEVNISSYTCIKHPKKKEKTKENYVDV
jgi:hypothetical protein